MINSTRFHLLALALILGLLLVTVGAQQPPAPGVYTVEQATAGRAAYQTNCASCHRADLAGSNEAPQLAGGDFLSEWGTKTTRDLFTFIQTSMPPTNPATLGDAAYASIVAYILQANGAAPGPQAFAATTNVAVRAVALAQPVPAQAAQAAAAPQNPDAAPAAAGGGGRGGPAPPARRGVTVAGEVPNYVPVTDEMLKNPPAGDWLMVRRNYQGWSNSPLNQITTNNVQDLKLAWVWAMNEGGASEPDAARAQRHHLSRSYRQRRAGARRSHRRSDLGIPRWPGSGRCHAQHGDLPGQGVFATSDAAWSHSVRRPACESHRDADRRPREEVTRPRPVDRHQRKLIRVSTAATASKTTDASSADSAATGKLLWRFNTVARPEEPGGTLGQAADDVPRWRRNVDRRQLRPDLNLTYWVSHRPKPWCRRAAI